ncbi:MAG: macro domain-containing protein [Bacteroidota bacterium]
MRTKELHGVTIECVRGDIAKQPGMDAVVNAANAHLHTGGGVAGAIHRAAGPGLEAECRNFAPIRPGEAVITGAHNLPNRYVIHCLGPVYGVADAPAELLASCYRRALELAEGNGISSIAFPAISTGAFGYPMEPAARIALSTIMDMIPHLSNVRQIRIVLFGEADRMIYEGLLNKMLRQEEE